MRNSSIPRILIVGSGFAGFHTARHLERRLSAGAAEVVLVSPRDYLLYSPLLPEVCTGTIEPRHVAVSLRQALPRTRTVLGNVTAVDLGARSATISSVEDGGLADASSSEHWDRLVLTPGSVTRQFDTPSVADHALGVKTLREALFLRDHLLTQLDRADELPDTAAGDAERRERLGVVAVGAGYSSTEVIAQLERWLHTVTTRWDRVRATEVRWTLIDIAHTVLPELGPRLGQVAAQILRRRGIETRLGVTVASATDREVTLTDHTTVPARTLIWGAGVSANPLVVTLDLPLAKGRLVVDGQLQVPGVEHVWAAGDAAAVPDLTQAPTPTADVSAPGQRPVTPPTAQHAQRQGKALARNVAASLGVGRARRYRHHDLGLVADLGGRDALARPLGIPLTGWAAKAVARGYHLAAMPANTNRVRVAADWLLAAALPAEAVQLSEIPAADALMSAAQGTDIYRRSGHPRG